MDVCFYVDYDASIVNSVTMIAAAVPDQAPPARVPLVVLTKYGPSAPLSFTVSC